jgi:predicted Zn-dependent protease
VKDETDKQDRSPLEQQRGWRDLSEKNVMEVLERVGLVAPEGNVEKVLNTIVNNLMVTNNFDSRIEMRCRVLMTSDIEMFSMQNTIVLSRGLIDVVPNEETLAAMLAFEVADAMVPKPAQDQYGFSDILRR